MGGSRRPAAPPTPPAPSPVVAEPEPVVEKASRAEQEVAARRRARRIGARSLLGAGGATREEQDTLGVG